MAAHAEPRSRGQIRHAQIQIGKQLVSRQRPPLPASGDQFDRAGIHHGELRVRVRASIRCLRAAPLLPSIAIQSAGFIQSNCRRQLPQADAGPANNQIQRTHCLGDDSTAFNPDSSVSVRTWASSFMTCDGSSNSWNSAM